MNKKELTIGSIVYDVEGDEIREVVELRDSFAIFRDKNDADLIHARDYDLLGGVPIIEQSLLNIGFVWIDDSRKHLVFHFGDMRLSYRFDKRCRIARFIFKSDFQKSYVRISCHYIHELQNIMRFLTGSELEFKYKELTEE